MELREFFSEDGINLQLQSATKDEALKERIVALMERLVEQFTRFKPRDVSANPVGRILPRRCPSARNRRAQRADSIDPPPLRHLPNLRLLEAVREQVGNLRRQPRVASLRFRSHGVEPHD